MNDYLDNAVRFTDLKLAEKDYRLAAWLNVVFDGDTDPPLSGLRTYDIMACKRVLFRSRCAHIYVV